MELKKFKQLHKKFSSFPLNRNTTDTQEHNDYINALHDLKHCSDWYLKQQIKKAGIKTKHCCLEMSYHLIIDSETKEYDADAVITFTKKTKTYGIPIHDGGASYIKINYCPWCGKQLSKR